MWHPGGRVEPVPTHEGSAAPSGAGTGSPSPYVRKCTETGAVSPTPALVDAAQLGLLHPTTLPEPLRVSGSLFSQHVIKD